MSLKTLYYRLREVDTPVLLVVKDDKGYVSITERSLHPAAVVNEIIYQTFLCQKNRENRLGLQASWQKLNRKMQMSFRKLFKQRARIVGQLIFY